jgi:hypothetical protein
MTLITIPEVMAQTLGSFLAAETRGRIGASHAELVDLLPFAAKLTLECIGNSDALYHNIEHSMLVTLVGHDILVGRALQHPMTASDYANFILACLTHDIGYVRGVVQGDGAGHFVADVSGRTVQLPLGASDAALAPYHVDRSKLYVVERLDTVELLDAARIARAIEYKCSAGYQATQERAQPMLPVVSNVRCAGRNFIHGPATMITSIGRLPNYRDEAGLFGNRWRRLRWRV